MDGVLKEGDKIEVKLIEVDKKTGKYRLSRKVLLPAPAGKATSEAAAPSRDGARPDRKAPAEN